LRIGVGQPPENGNSIPHVLGRFSKDEEPLIAQSIQDAVSAVECILEENINIAMNRFNVIGT
jgi:PTH1 family peptidyl-tRNA hydrolase